MNKGAFGYASPFTKKKGVSEQPESQCIRAEVRKGQRELTNLIGRD